MIQVILFAVLFVESVDSSSLLCACTTSNTNVYINQTTKSSTLTRLSAGDCVTLLEEGTERIKISVNGSVGFVVASDVTKKQCSVEQTETAGQNLKRFLDHIDRNNVCMQEHCLNCACHTGGDHCGDCDSCHKHHLESEQICHEWLHKVDGAWSDWSTWQFCTTTCGGGVQTRTRNCDNPPKATVFGKNCEGVNRQQQSCNKQPCPISVDGVWSSWSAYSICTVTCGTGYKSRTRTCTSPRPQYNGKNCTGPTAETVLCNTDHCQVDGGWSAFSAYSVCSKSCGGGTMYRQRTCTNPTPAYHGALCSGSNLDIQSCNVNNCPVDGGWTSWGPYSACSARCSSQALGFQYAQRFCTNPTPKYNGQDCVGDQFKYVPCTPVCSSVQTTPTTVKILATTTTSTTTSLIFKGFTCDKIKTIQSLGTHSPIDGLKSHQCPDGIHVKSEAVPITLCNVPEKSAWHRGVNSKKIIPCRICSHLKTQKVLENCDNLPNYIAVASFIGDVYPGDGKAGVLISCNSTEIMIVSQECDSGLKFEHISKGSNSHFKDVPEAYFTITSSSD